MTTADGGGTGAAVAGPAGRMRRRSAPVLAAALLALPAPGWAGSVEAGADKIRSQRCIVCHDARGQGTDALFPNLAGQSEMYLRQQLEAFRAGRRQAPQMGILAQDLSDEDIADLAAYYASLPPCEP